MKISSETKDGWVLWFTVVAGFALVLLQLHGLRPQPQEKYVGMQTVELRDEKYVCGNVQENRDKESLYCTGFTDGYSWAVKLLEIDNYARSLK